MAESDELGKKNLEHAPPYEDWSEAPTFMVDGFAGVVHHNNIARIRFFEIRMGGGAGNDAYTVRRTAFHMAVQLDNLVGIHRALGLLIEDFRNDGLVHADEKSADEKA